MRVLCAVLVTVFVGQSCYAHLGRRASSDSKVAALAESPGLGKHDADHLKTLSRGIRNKIVSVDGKVPSGITRDSQARRRGSTEEEEEDIPLDDLTALRSIPAPHRLSHDHGSGERDGKFNSAKFVDSQTLDRPSTKEDIPLDDLTGLKNIPTSHRLSHPPNRGERRGKFASDKPADSQTLDRRASTKEDIPLRAEDSNPVSHGLFHRPDKAEVDGKLISGKPADSQTLDRRASTKVDIPLRAPESNTPVPHGLFHRPHSNGGSQQDGRARGPHLHPLSPLRFPIDQNENGGNENGGNPCKDSPVGSGNVPTAPPNVCDFCPSENGMNPLDPCKCVGVGGTSAGMISISCPSSIVSLDQLSDIFHNTKFLTTHVFQFSLQGSSANGALTRDIWGQLDFKYVSINRNRITDVDNGAFIASNATLVSLDLSSNEIKSYIAMYNNLPNLLYLSLANNNISLIYSEDFQYPKLTDLDLSHNQITSIGMHSFAALKRLRSLNLSYNLLTSVGEERFTFFDHDYSNVLVIDLSNNQISYLSETAFLGIQSVEIDFRSNHLHTLQEEIFAPIIHDSFYFVYFHFIGNDMVCDCDLLWVLGDGNTLFCFDNFECTNSNETLYTLDPADLGQCSARARRP